MSELYAYLDAGLLDGGAPRAGLDAEVELVAKAWLAEGVEAAALELGCELLARMASELGPARLDGAALLSATAWLALALPVQRLLRRAAARPLGATELAALAVHLLDVSERMALFVLVPELPAMFAKADQSGGAARQVGLARHLKG